MMWFQTSVVRGAAVLQVQIQLNVCIICNQDRSSNIDVRVRTTGLWIVTEFILG
jgi:hypothetical protein